MWKISGKVATHFSSGKFPMEIFSIVVVHKASKLILFFCLLCVIQLGYRFISSISFYLIALLYYYYINVCKEVAKQKLKTMIFSYFFIYIESKLVEIKI
jgi:hypothetical protein